MNKIFTDNSNQQSDRKSTKQPNTNDSVSKLDKSDILAELSEEIEVEITFQRRPQFRLKENMKRRFS